MSIAAIIGLVGPLLPAMIKGIEGLFGSKTGPAKLATVEQMVSQLLAALGAAGKAGGAPIPENIRAAIEAVLAALKAQGAIDAGQPATAQPFGSFTAQVTIIPGASK